MAKTSKEIADALGAMMNGRAPAEETAASELVLQPPTTTPQPARPIVKTAAPSPIAAAPVAKAPVKTGAPAPKAAVRRPAPVPNPIPSAPTAPAAARVTSQSPATTKRPSRPAAPLPAPAAAPKTAKPTIKKTVPAQPPANRQTVEYAKPKAAKPKKESIFATLDFRQTVIPPLLVGGTGLIALAGLFFAQPHDAALRQLGATIPLIAGAIGIVLLALAGLNMVKVNKQLIARRVAARAAARSR